MQLVNIVIIIAAIIAALPLIKTPACLVTLAYVAYRARGSKSSSKISHSSTFEQKEFYDDLIKVVSDDKENEIISAWDNITKHTKDLKLIKSSLPTSIFGLSSYLTKYSENQIADCLVLIGLTVVSIASASIFGNHQLFCLIYSVVSIATHLFFGQGKRIGEVNVTNWDSWNKFIKSMTVYFKSSYETQLEKWISRQIKIANAEQKIIPEIFKQMKIHPERIAVRNGFKCEKYSLLNELIKENDRYLFSKNYDAVLVRTHEDQSIYISNGYIEIPNSSVGLDVLGGDFVGKISRTYIKILATDDKIRTYDQCGKYTTKCQSEIIQIASACNLN